MSDRMKWLSPGLAARLSGLIVRAKPCIATKAIALMTGLTCHPRTRFSPARFALTLAGKTNRPA